MKKKLLPILAALTGLVTGCPHNEYFIELTPRGEVLERTLVFYRADGSDTNGVPKYQAFPSNELEAISSVYPASSVLRTGERHTASGTFSRQMPRDVGGAGAYTNLVTSLGRAGLYAERFRGQDDMHAQLQDRFRAADQLVDLAIGWSRMELGREPHYHNLRLFLDGDFRRDMRNLVLYFWAGRVAADYKSEAGEEFIVRFGQYLMERGYLKLDDLPYLCLIQQGHADARLCGLFQRLVAEKMGVPASAPLPKALAFLGDGGSTAKSWEKYLAGTALHRANLRRWEKEKKTNPKVAPPNPSQVADELIGELVGGRADGEDDRLTVKLSLPTEPTHTNGKWDEARRQVVWEAPLEAATNAARLPVVCYASWSEPDEKFQTEHFGRVLLRGDDLQNYCVWRGGLAPAAATEWDSMLAGLPAGENWATRVEAFRFSSEIPPVNASDSAFGRELLKSAREKTAPGGGR